MDKSLNTSEDLEIRQLIKSLCSNDGLERQNARTALAEKGNKSIDFLMELLNSPKHMYRWEAIKTIKEINDPESIPIYLNALEDEKSDIRWIAAEGLINMGNLSVEPLLKRLLEKSEAVFVLEGAHHVFIDLKKNKMLPDDFPIDKLLLALKDTGLVENIKSIAHELLENSKC
ncbi:MAG: HEAT repeat domain-containing protein [Ignavibacteriaceae bacterium]